MTNREFFAELTEGAVISKEVAEKAKEELEKLDKALARRKEKQSEKQKENNEIKTQILELLKNSEEPLTARKVGEEIGHSTQKASALLTQMRKDGIIQWGEEVKRTKTYLPIQNSEEEIEEE